MNDPFLAAHEILHRVYLISPGRSPVSIRDQMLRGRMAVDSLRGAGIIDPVPLLVVGAGAGGATAAMHSAKLGINTLLIDRAPSAFALQSSAKTRYLDPTQYDWPLDQYPSATFPWNGTNMPLPFPATTADQLALRWTAELNRLHSTSTTLDVSYQTEVVTILNLRSGLVRVVFTGLRSGYHDFGAIIWAAGAGTEECRVTVGKAPVRYEGRPFWSTDPFEIPNCGLPSQPSVLIAGAGDGGLQDFLRIVTGERAAVDIFRKCNIPDHIAQRIQSAEDRAIRGWLWAPKGTEYEHNVMLELQREHEVAADAALQDPQVQQGLARLFPSAPLPIQLVYRCSHFTAYYGLNRFLVVLIAKYLLRQFAVDVLLQQHAVVDVRAADGHACLDPSGTKPNGGYQTPVCHGLPHDVTLEDAPDCVHPAISPRQTPTTVDVLIIRYGLRSDIPASLPPTHRHPPQLRTLQAKHLLPYHLPT